MAAEEKKKNSSFFSLAIILKEKNGVSCRCEQ